MYTIFSPQYYVPEKYHYMSAILVDLQDEVNFYSFSFCFLPLHPTYNNPVTFILKQTCCSVRKPRNESLSSHFTWTFHSTYIQIHNFIFCLLCIIWCINMLSYAPSTLSLFCSCWRDFCRRFFFCTEAKSCQQSAKACLMASSWLQMPTFLNSTQHQKTERTIN